MVIAYRRPLGVMYEGLAEDILDESFLRRLEGKVKLILTSPAFPLNYKKRYGNLRGNTRWLWIL
jgi:site-specific DNA-methyltransferase (cytosine-N4-specific)